MNIKKYCTVFLAFIMYFNVFSQAHAASGLGGWSLSNPIAQGASTLYTGMKNALINGKNVVKTSTALITPNASQVAKVLARGAGGYALSVAVAQLIGDGIDWVMDPANNQIKYRPTVVVSSYLLLDGNWLSFDDYQSAYNSGVSKRCAAGVLVTVEVPWHPVASSSNISASEQKIKCGSSGFYMRRIEAKEQSSEEKTIPLPTVAAQVISNANSGDTNAKAVTTAVAADVVNDAQNDDTKARPIVNQLEKNATTQADDTTATGQTKPNTTTGGSDLALEFPTFCGWAPQVCEAAQTVISFPQTLTEWWEQSNQKADSWAKSITEAWNAVKDWVKESEKEDTEVDISKPDQNEPDTSINFSTACPAKIPLNFSWNGQSLDFSFDFTIWCQAISTFVYPIVVALGSLHALYIVAGVRQDG